MERKRMKNKDLEALLSVAVAERSGMPEGLTARVVAEGTAGFADWGVRRQRSGLRRRCLAAAVAAVLLCSFAPAFAPEAARTVMIVNNGTDRAQVLEGVRSMLEHSV